MMKAPTLNRKKQLVCSGKCQLACVRLDLLLLLVQHVPWSRVLAFELEFLHPCMFYVGSVRVAFRLGFGDFKLCGSGCWAWSWCCQEDIPALPVPHLQSLHTPDCGFRVNSPPLHPMSKGNNATRSPASSHLIP